MDLQRILDFLKAVKTRGLRTTLELLSSTLKDHFLNAPFSKETRSETLFYLPSRYQPLRACLKRFHKEGYSFFDIGAGMGRAMVIAAESGFKKVEGVELNLEPFKIAEEVLAGAFELYPEVEFNLLLENATQVDFKREKTFYYLYDPFLDDELRAVIAGIQKDSGSSFIIYHNNIADKKGLFLKNSGLKLEEEYLFEGNRFYLYSIV